MAIQVLILAAGRGQRMRSCLPKVLHHLAGKPLLGHVLNIAEAIAPNSEPIVVYGHQGKTLRETLTQHTICWVEQREQLGTGHAVREALPKLNDENRVLILYGDVPLISAATLKQFITTTPESAVGMLTTELHHPAGYGRIKRNQAQQVIGIVEEKDASEEERAITEVNSGIYLVPAKYLKKWLPTLSNQNKQGEYYLTDIIPLAAKENIAIHTSQPQRTEEILGVNDRGQLAYLERIYQFQQAEKWMQQGVTIIDPARFDVRGDVQIGHDVTIDVNVILEGQVTIADHCTIGANCILRNVTLAEGTEVRPNSLLEDATVAAHCIIGPFARLRPGTILAAGAHIGNFVEIKNSTVGENTKINHLSYVGDATVGKRVNIGAGTITCNYDGINKYKTTIGDDAFIGSDTQLIAPVTVGNAAIIGAGSTITKDVPPQLVTVTQKIEQRSREKKRAT